jgi:hypothetical protein
MKTKIIFLTILLLAILPGCLVKSLHPYYADKDLLFKEELLGNWSGKDSSGWEISRHMKKTGLFNPGTPDKAYDIIYTDSKGRSKFIAHIFLLDEQLYIDFYPEEDAGNTDLGSFHYIQAHSLARLTISKNNLTIQWFNEEWLMNLFNQNRIRIAHERIPYDPDDKNPDRDQVILTAPTEDLQKFILKYGKDPNAFDKGKNKSDYTFVLSRKLPSQN